MSIYINEILTDDSELYNRVLAYGAGDGINRPMVVVEDETSIAAYGERETIEDFPDAVDYADLSTKATAFLDTAKDPIQEISFTYYFDSAISRENLEYNGEVVEYNGEPVTAFTGGSAEQLRRGDTVRVVSRLLGLSFTGVVDELDWQPGQVDVRLGKPSYNLFEVLRGPERKEEREKVALGLPVPIGFLVSTAAPGVIIKLNPYTNSRAVGVELYGSDTLDLGSDFTADQSTLLVKGGGTRFEFPKLTPGTTYYFKARSYDARGDFSGFTDVKGAIAGFFDGGTIGGGTIDSLTPFASALRPPRNVSSLPTLPNFEYPDGDLVVYDNGSGARIYENQSGSWVQLTATDLEGRTVAHQVVAGQVVAGAISADEIAANTITSDEIAANAITTGKISAGHVIIDDGSGGDGNADRLRVNTTSGGGGTDQAVMGKITSLPGVPSGVDWGFWAEMNNGFFVPGSIRIDQASGGRVSSSDIQYWPSGGSSITPQSVSTQFLSTASSYTLDDNETLYVISIVTEFLTGYEQIQFSGIEIGNNGFKKYGPGGSHFVSFKPQITMYGRYTSTVAANTYKPIIGITNIVLRSYS